MDMTTDAISHFAPEIALLITACVVLILGLSPSAFVRSWVAPISLAILLVALRHSAIHADQALGATFAGLRMPSSAPTAPALCEGPCMTEASS